MIQRERGVVTLDEINSALPEEEISPIKGLSIMMFEDMGVSVARDGDGANGSGGGKGIWSRPRARRGTPAPPLRRISGAPTTPYACT